MGISKLRDESNSMPPPSPSPSASCHTCIYDHVRTQTHTHTHTGMYTRRHIHTHVYMYTQACRHTPLKLRSTKPEALCQSVVQCARPHPQPPGLIGSCQQRCLWYGRCRVPGSEFSLPSPSAGREPPGPPTALVPPVDTHWEPAARPVL